MGMHVAGHNPTLCGDIELQAPATYDGNDMMHRTKRSIAPAVLGTEATDWTAYMCAMVKSRNIGDGHPSF